MQKLLVEECMTETQMDLEIIILSEINHTETGKCCMILLKQNLKNNTNESTYKTETDSQVQKANLRLPKGKERWDK